MSATPAFRSSPAAAELLRAIEVERAVPLFLLLDDSGCCGPGNVFLQAEAPRAEYVGVGAIGSTRVFAHPRFLQGVGPARLFLDEHAAPLDDSLSLETRRSRRFRISIEPA